MIEKKTQCEKKEKMEGEETEMNVSANVKFKEIELCHVLFLVCFVSSFCFWCFCFGLNGQLNICLVFLHLFHDVPHRFLHPHFNYISSSRKVKKKMFIFVFSREREREREK